MGEIVSYPYTYWNGVELVVIVYALRYAQNAANNLVFQIVPAPDAVFN